MVSTIFKNIYDKQPFYIKVDDALNRIKTGKSKTLVEEIRNHLDKERANNLKANLPSICFSGKFSVRKDENLLEHSGFIVLDFDGLKDLREKQTEIISKPFVYACWVSPSGNGLKALVKIADGKKHREHFQALQDIFPEIDRSGINESRVCYESYDPEMYISENVKPFTKTKKIEVIELTQAVTDNEEIFKNIVRWLVNKGDAFQSGERNIFIYKLASACCRFGIHEQNSLALINNAYLTLDNSFSRAECQRTIQSAYRSNKGLFGSASFDKDILVEKVSRREINIDPEIFDKSIRPKDVIFGEDVKSEAMSIYDNGYPHVDGIGVPDLDELFKDKRGEITLLSGIGNYGKSTYFKWRLLMRVILFGNKFAIFGPEDNPAQEFYHDFVEMLLGCDCTPANPARPSRDVYDKTYDFVTKHIFYVYPKELSPTPEYIKERFLELIIKENVDGCAVDPFNQLANDYNTTGGRSDKYLESALSDWARFAQTNNIFFTIIAHPKLMKKEQDGNYACPDVFDIADGAMWNNKMDNILIYHRPLAQTEPQNAICEFHSKKIRRQKQVGKKGTATFEMVRSKRRFFFNGVDYLQKVLNDKDFPFLKKESIFSQNGFRPLAKSEYLNETSENPF